jgi:imidazole glycerol-phosphate synthase subunit HisH
MSEGEALRVGIVDYGVGNLHSIATACARVGLAADLVTSARAIAAAPAIILPGTGAFGSAMDTLRRLDLTGALSDAVASGRPVLGVCLGLQLLMTESEEFGTHKGLGIIEGTVEHLGAPRDRDRRLKVPHVGWARVQPVDRPWAGTPMSDVPPGAFMYFVHTYHARPADPGVVLSVSQYGDVPFCSSVHRANLFACQFHPERSGPDGLSVYRQFRRAMFEADRRLAPESQ